MNRPSAVISLLQAIEHEWIMEMIELYSEATPNGLKVSIALEELGLDYKVHQLYLGGDQFTPEFTEMNANNKIPVLVDDGFVITESGAILTYLAEKTGRLLPAEPKAAAKVMEALMFQMGSLGPMFGQYLVFAAAWGNKFPEVTSRYFLEVSRIMEVMNVRLARNEFLAGDTFSIADIASIPWIRLAAIHPAGTDLPLKENENLSRWYETVSKREAVIRGLANPEPFPVDKQFEGFVKATIGLSESLAAA